jgi:1,2-phenylacetyl-CoA epoxidase catalytic subunit
MACLDRPFAGWGDFVVANFLLDSALTILLEAARDSPYEPLRQRARKIVQEEQAHWAHARGWLRRLDADPADRTSLADALTAQWDDAFTWLGAPGDPLVETLAAAGLLAARPNALRQRLLARLRSAGATGGLLDDLASRPLPWDRWDAHARRLRSAP